MQYNSTTNVRVTRRFLLSVFFGNSQQTNPGLPSVRVEGVDWRAISTTHPNMMSIYSRPTSTHKINHVVAIQIEICKTDIYKWWNFVQCVHLEISTQYCKALDIVEVLYMLTILHINFACSIENAWTNKRHLDTLHFGDLPKWSSCKVCCKLYTYHNCLKWQKILSQLVKFEVVWTPYLNVSSGKCIKTVISRPLQFPTVALRYSLESLILQVDRNGLKKKRQGEQSLSQGYTFIH